jgi:hypothetical protein
MDAGLSGAVRIEVMQREALAPQELDAVTQTLPFVIEVDGHLTETVVVPCPLMITAPAETVQL